MLSDGYERLRARGANNARRPTMMAPLALRRASAAHSFGLICGIFGYLLSGCTSLASGDDRAQPLLTDDPKWACVERGDGPPPAPEMPFKTLSYIVPIVDFAHAPSEVDPTHTGADALIPNLKIEVCRAMDPSCSPPVAVTISQPAKILGVPFVYQLDIPGGLETLFLRLTEDPPPADPLSRHLPTYYYFSGPLVGSQKGTATISGEAIPIPTFGQIVGFSADFGVALDPTTGTLGVRTIDCTGKRVEGVTLTLSPPVDSAVGYTLTKAGVPLPADPSAPRPTDSRGVAGFANLPPGARSVSGISPYNTKYGHPTFRIAAGAFTLTEVRPDSLPPQ